MTIEELIAEGEAKIKTAQIEQGQRAAEQARAHEEERLSRVGLFLSDVREAVDPALHPYLTLPEPINEFDPSDDCHALFRVTGCTDIRVRFFRNWNMPNYKAAKTPLTYVVMRPKWDHYDGLLWNSESFTDLSLALVSARAYQHDLDEMIARKDEADRQARDEAKASEEREEQQARADAAQRQAQDRERQDLLDLLADDLVAFHQAERRNAEDARAREVEARDDADRAERKLKQASGTSQGQAQRGG